MEVYKKLMSADGTNVCPRCLREVQGRIQNVDKTLDQLYKSPPEELNDEVLREWFEIGVNPVTLEFWYYYHAECDDCGWKYDVNEKREKIAYE